MQVLSKRLSHRNHRRFRYSPHFFRGWRYLFPRGRHVPRITWSYLTTAWHSISGLSLTQNWPMILSASMIPNPVSPKNQNLPTHPRYRSRACLRQLGCTLPRVHFSDPLNEGCEAHAHETSSLPLPLLSDWLLLRYCYGSLLHDDDVYYSWA